MRILLSCCRRKRMIAKIATMITHILDATSGKHQTVHNLVTKMSTATTTPTPDANHQITHITMKMSTTTAPTPDTKHQPAHSILTKMSAMTTPTGTPYAH